MTSSSLSSPRPPPHRQTTMSSVAISMVGGGAMDGVTVATAPLSHNHHLDYPRPMKERQEEKRTAVLWSFGNIRIPT
jgi:hypothetical protein